MKKIFIISVICMTFFNQCIAIELSDGIASVGSIDTTTIKSKLENLSSKSQKVYYQSKADLIQASINKLATDLTDEAIAEEYYKIGVELYGLQDVIPSHIKYGDIIGCFIAAALKGHVNAMYRLTNIAIDEDGLAEICWATGNVVRNFEDFTQFEQKLESELARGNRSDAFSRAIEEVKKLQALNERYKSDSSFQDAFDVLEAKLDREENTEVAFKKALRIFIMEKGFPETEITSYPTFKYALETFEIELELGSSRKVAFQLALDDFTERYSATGLSDVHSLDEIRTANPMATPSLSTSSLSSYSLSPNSVSSVASTRSIPLNSASTQSTPTKPDRADLTKSVDPQAE